MPNKRLLVRKHSSEAKDIIIETPQGKLLGRRLPDAASKNGIEGIHVFKGIPYALPPVGQRRWKPAEPALGWNGVRLATAFSPVCPQPQSKEDTFYYRPIPQMSEDCLYLNVWAPAGTTQKLPVMVWIHGGALIEGAGSMSLYDGTELASKGVVVVTINYRLNVFGYFSHPELSAESPHNASGNYGTTDQIQALKWVQQNIAAFGGDPQNVTVFGESAGALSVSHLLASPLAKGLFHRAIMQSSYLPAMPTLKKKHFGILPAEEVGIQLAEFAGSYLLHATECSLEELRHLPADELLKISTQINFSTEAVVDNWIFPKQVFEIFECNEQHDIPILIGFNSGEAYPFATIEGLIAPIPLNAESYTTDIKARYGELADRYLAIYPPEDLHEAVFAPSRDGFYGWAAEKFAKMTQGLKSSVYLYYFDHAPEWAEKSGMGAFHTAELLYTFNNVNHNFKYSPNWPDLSPRNTDISMGELISDYWVSFAYNGIPFVNEAPRWQPYTDSNRHYMIFKNGSAQPSKNLLPGRFELHDKIVSERRKRDDISWSLTQIGLLAPTPSERTDSKN